MTSMTNTSTATRGEAHDTPPESGGVRKPWNPLTPPPLQITHTPGWRLTVQPDPSPTDVTCIVFQTTQPDFGLDFEADVYADGTTSSCICPTGVSPCTSNREGWTPDALADLATATERLQVWLDDCATALQWTIDHTAEISRRLRAGGRTPAQE
ncbi:hypothetical protein JS532_08450 [Bifidobacterium callimiconis]|uniref:hypothetical protein n=1 Tax=Bifidobacterium callimiconis TaxID=2306973 RepID=UPI001BDCE239|nr:hypothetical protein [Bifidobacterium callimiconis]MBT1177590.1 hypothetical protein [Bifidobacterium callimiconis]